MPSDVTSAQQFVDLMAKWVRKTYPDLRVPPYLNVVPRNPVLGRRRGAVASSNADTRYISLYDPMLARGLNSLGMNRTFTGGEKYPIQTGLHEILHQEGPRYGDSRNDRFLEEGLAESVSADMAPDYARTLPYAPQKLSRAEDGSYYNPNDDFRFKTDTYAQNVKAIRLASLNAALRQMQPGWEGLEDPGASPEAMAYRRMLLHQTAKQRARTYSGEYRRMKREREKPDYIPRTVQTVGRVATAAARLPRDQIAVSTQRVGSAVRAVARGVPNAVQRRVNAHRGGF